MRIPLSRPEDLPPDVREAFVRYPLNLTLLCAQAKTLYPGYRIMTQAMFSELSIPHQERELLALGTLHLVDGRYPWVQHVEIARSLDMGEAKIEALAHGAFESDVFSPREHALLAFVREVVASVHIDDPTFDAVAKIYDARQIVEAIFVIGNYMLLPRFSEIARLPIDGVAGAAIAHAAIERVAERDEASFSA